MYIQEKFISLIRGTLLERAIYLRERINDYLAEVPEVDIPYITMDSEITSLIEEVVEVELLIEILADRVSINSIINDTTDNYTEEILLKTESMWESELDYINVVGEYLNDKSIKEVLPRLAPIVVGRLLDAIEGFCSNEKVSDFLEHFYEG